MKSFCIPCCERFKRLKAKKSKLSSKYSFDGPDGFADSGKIEAAAAKIRQLKLEGYEIMHEFYLLSSTQRSRSFFLDARLPDDVKSELFSRLLNFADLYLNEANLFYHQIGKKNIPGSDDYVDWTHHLKVAELKHDENFFEAALHIQGMIEDRESQYFNDYTFFKGFLDFIKSGRSLIDWSRFKELILQKKEKLITTRYNNFFLEIQNDLINYFDKGTSNIRDLNIENIDTFFDETINANFDLFSLKHTKDLIIILKKIGLDEEKIEEYASAFLKYFSLNIPIKIGINGPRREELVYYFYEIASEFFRFFSKEEVNNFVDRIIDESASGLKPDIEKLIKLPRKYRYAYLLYLAGDFKNARKKVSMNEDWFMMNAVNPKKAEEDPLLFDKPMDFLNKERIGFSRIIQEIQLGGYYLRKSFEIKGKDIKTN